MFQSTRPHGARRKSYINSGEWCEFQSTRPHGARHHTLRIDVTDKLVSIHAPARGATGPIATPWAGHKVSIHAPARGATNKSSPIPN